MSPNLLVFFMDCSALPTDNLKLCFNMGLLFFIYPFLPPLAFCLFYFFKTGFLGCFRTYSVEHTGLKLRDLPVTVSRMLVLQVCPTTTWSDLCNFILWVEVFCLHVYSCTMGMLSTHKDQRRISGPLEVELQEQFVTCLVSAWN